MTDYQGALWAPTTNYFPDTGKKSFVIIHGTAGGSSAQEIASYFQGTEGTDNPVSSNYIVGQDGTVIQCVSEKDGAYAQGVVTTGHDPWWSNVSNPNYVCISIEHVKSDDANATAITPAQQAASFALIKDICKRNGIHMRAADANGGITGHYSIDPINRSRCPGAYDWDALWTYLGENTMTIPAGWSDNGAILTAPNKIPVILGFRDYVLANNWHPNNWPLEAEQHLTVLEQSNPSLGGGQAQTFRNNRLEYKPELGIFEGWLGQELLWYQGKAAQLMALITTSNIQQINTLATQIVQKSQIQ